MGLVVDAVSNIKLFARRHLLHSLGVADGLDRWEHALFTRDLHQNIFLTCIRSFLWLFLVTALDLLILDA